MTTARRLLVLASACALWSAPVSADPVHITAGAVVWSGSLAGSGSSVTLTGGGFTFDGRTGFGVFGPGVCLLPACAAGSDVDLSLFWSGSDLPGQATWSGQTYAGVGSVGGPSSLLGDWMGTLTIPAGFSGGTLSAPFLFAGQFTVDPTTTQPGVRVDLAGSGLASATFNPSAVQPGGFILSALRYDFEAAPVPEPMSMLLVGTGLAGIAALRRRRRPGPRA